MKVLLLGASGLLGHNVLRRLVDEGHEVVALVRRPDAIRLETSSFEQHVGSLLDYPMLSAAARGCDAVVNCAGTTDMSLLHRSDYMPVNCELCRMLVRLLEEHGISTLVHTSTANTIGYGTSGRPADESWPMLKPFTKSHYAESKRLGEGIVLDAARRWPERHIIVINPGFMIGPYDVKPSSGRLLEVAYRRRLMVAPSGGKSFVHVGDVAQAVVNALTMGRNGERYLAVNSHGNLSIKEIYRMQASLMGYRQCVVTVPDWMLSVAGFAGDVLRWTGIRTEVATRNVRQLMVREYYSNHHAASELHMPETPVSDAIKSFFQWRQNINH